jgi:hypothetical protein
MHQSLSSSSEQGNFTTHVGQLHSRHDLAAVRTLLHLYMRHETTKATQRSKLADKHAMLL